MAALTPMAAMAQTAAPDATSTDAAEPATEVIVTGIRASLRNSLQAKRTAEAVVDSVTAEDAGKFPDTNISESLQRVPGVAIQRNAGEGQFVSVRGLGPEFNNVLVNGRTIPTDNQGREFSFDVLSADLISRADVYKTSLPELPEGGIGATINIQTARPLDTRGTHASVNVFGSYDSLTKDYSPNMSGIFSYANPSHNFGVVASLSYTDRESKQNSVQTDVWVSRPATVITGSESSVGLPASAATTQTFLMPSNLGFHQQDASRKRVVGNLTLQFKPNDDWLITIDSLYSRLDQKMTDSIYSAYFNPAFINPVIASDGTVQSFTRPGTTFVANNPALASQVGASQNDNIVTTNNRLANTYVFGVNSKWTVSDTLKVEGDLSFSRATGTGVNPYIVIGEQSVNGQTFALNAGGKTPILTIPDTVTDPSLMRSHWSGISGSSVNDNILDGRLEAKWTHHKGFFNGLTVGIDYSDREKTDAYSSSPYGCAYCGYHYPANPALLQVQSFNNFISGVQVPVAAHFTYDPNAVVAWLQDPSNLAHSNDPATALSFAGGPLTPVPQPSGTIDVTEKVTSAYVDSNWSGDNWSGNVGLRYVSVKSQSIGYGTPLLTAITNYPADSNYQYTYGTPTRLTSSNSYSDLLPSANLKISLTEDMLLRFGASRTLTRPTLTDLGISNTYGGYYGAPTSSGGNPDLLSMHSNNYDVSWEWYLSKINYLAVAAFHKDVTDFIETTTVLQTEPVIPEKVYDTRPRNGAKGTINGYEVSAQYALNETAGWASGFGVSANYTHVDATAVRSDAADKCGYDGLSPDSYNLAGFYDNGTLQTRIAYNWRSAFLVNCFGSGVLPRNRAAYGQVDASLRYNINDRIQLYLDGVNLTDSLVKEYEVDTTHFLLLEQDGRRINFGVRYKFQ
ncbi:hypothetical protein AEAC466_05085 [Asticcacaulis sp. AC466]|uniref:TonB-dependent receptor n=1 Tax=Asticcacaulis sp. AC466 TaxID=1282362 RepID=UPI0003C3C868|nr:TonB-dependent receptor [Asticcacaulis sp. AC466]ESQ85085.1 hypothetical protein AEAC466_05085 [Asticcacaulis sp. AC466]